MIFMMNADSIDQLMCFSLLNCVPSPEVFVLFQFLERGDSYCVTSLTDSLRTSNIYRKAGLNFFGYKSAGATVGRHNLAGWLFRPAWKILPGGKDKAVQPTTVLGNSRS